MLWALRAWRGPRGTGGCVSDERHRSGEMRAARARRGNLYLRVVATVMIALMLHVFMGASWTWLWAGPMRPPSCWSWC
jgi:hypothetical protein